MCFVVLVNIFQLCLCMSCGLFARIFVYDCEHNNYIFNAWFFVCCNIPFLESASARFLNPLPGEDHGHVSFFRFKSLFWCTGFLLVPTLYYTKSYFIGWLLPLFHLYIPINIRHIVHNHYHNKARVGIFLFTLCLSIFELARYGIRFGFNEWTFDAVVFLVEFCFILVVNLILISYLMMLHGRTFRHNKRFQVNAILLLRDTRKKKLTRWNNLEKKFTCDPATIILEFCGPDYDQTISRFDDSKWRPICCLLCVPLFLLAWFYGVDYKAIRSNPNKKQFLLTETTYGQFSTLETKAVGRRFSHNTKSYSLLVNENEPALPDTYNHFE